MKRVSLFYWLYVILTLAAILVYLATSFGSLRHGTLHSALLWIVIGSNLLIIPWQLRQIKRSLNYEDWKRQCRCLNCGYDIRATPDRCPECGTVPKDKSQS